MRSAGVSSALADLLSTDPGTRVVKLGEDWEDVIGGYPSDPSQRPVFSTIPLNTPLAERLKIAAGERKQYGQLRGEVIGVLKDWIAKQRQRSGVTEPLESAP